MAETSTIGISGGSTSQYVLPRRTSPKSSARYSCTHSVVSIKEPKYNRANANCVPLATSIANKKTYGFRLSSCCSKTQTKKASMRERFPPLSGPAVIPLVKKLLPGHIGGCVWRPKAAMAAVRFNFFWLSPSERSSLLSFPEQWQHYQPCHILQGKSNSPEQQ